MRGLSNWRISAVVVLLSSTAMAVGAAHAADGQAIAANGNGRDAPACSACHGDRGEGRPDAGYPRLAGLDRDYLVHQLNAFGDGSRDNETMSSVAKALTPEERQSVAGYYAGLTAVKADEPKQADDKTVALGASLADRGDWSKGLPGCAQCHGKAGRGVGQSFPGLAGQSAEYVASQLKAWKDGKRTDDPLHLMTGVASKLSEDQVAAVAAYYASLPVTAAVATPGSKP